jgi:peptidoglycan/LPS O-acetylase OafA/YrhL
MPVATRPTHLRGLDWLRFALALYLVLFHTLPAYPGLPAWLYAAVSAGYVSTSLFFILSGFILAHLYLDDRGTLLMPARKFLGLRLLTLYPVHVLGFLLAAGSLGVQLLTTGSALAVADIPPALQGTTSESLLVPLNGVEIALNALAHLLLIHAWNPYYQVFNVPSWSISALFFFYLVFVVMGGWFFRARRPGLWLLTLSAIYLVPPVVFSLAGDFRPVVTGFLHTNPLVRLPEFLCGVVLCRWLRDRPALLTWRPVPVALSTIALMAAVTGALSRSGPAGYYLLHNGALLPLQLVLIGTLARVERSPWRRVDHLMAKLAGATLSIFILHMPLFSMLTRLQKWMATLGNGTPDSWQGFWLQVKTAPLYFPVYPLLLIAIVTLSLLCQEFFVKRARTLLRTRLAPKLAPAGDAQAAKPSTDRPSWPA